MDQDYPDAVRVDGGRAGRFPASRRARVCFVLGRRAIGLLDGRPLPSRPNGHRHNHILVRRPTIKCRLTDTTSPIGVSGPKATYSGQAFDSSRGKETHMLRRRVVFVGRPLLRRPRLLGAALIGGLGFAAGRASRRPPESVLLGHDSPLGAPDIAEKLGTLAEMHASGTLSDEEFAVAKARLLGSSPR